MPIAAQHERPFFRASVTSRRDCRRQSTRILFPGCLRSADSPASRWTPGPAAICPPSDQPRALLLERVLDLLGLAAASGKPVEATVTSPVSHEKIGRMAWNQDFLDALKKTSRQRPETQDFAQIGCTSHCRGAVFPCAGRPRFSGSLGSSGSGRRRRTRPSCSTWVIRRIIDRLRSSRSARLHLRRLALP